MSTEQNTVALPTLQETIIAKQVALVERFTPFTTVEFIEANKDIAKRQDLVMSEFEVVKNEIEKERLYRIEGDSLVAISKLVQDPKYFDTLRKGVDTIHLYISLNELIESIGDKDVAVSLNGDQVDYIGGMFSQLTYNDLAEALELKSIKDSLEVVYQQVWISKKELSILGQVVQDVERAWQMANLPKEDVQEIIINEAESEDK